MADVDAVVIGSGPNGLVAACHLARAGWSVLVCEQAPSPGGGVRSGEATLPGFVHDHCAGFFPLVEVSPWFRSLDLGGAGLEWCRAPVATAHPRPGEEAAWIGSDTEETARCLDALHPGDGARWAGLLAWLGGVEGPLLRALLHPLPDLRALGSLAARLGARGLLRLGKLLAAPVRDLASMEFEGQAPGQVLGALALHADTSPDQAGSAAFGLILAYLAQTVGFPVPRGGAGRITEALLRRLAEHGGRVVCEARVDRVLVRRGRAVGVRARGLGEVGVRHAVLADVGAPALFRDLVGDEHLPADVRQGIRRFRYGPGVFKVDWALGGPVPWSAEPCRRAATVHLGDGLDDLTRYWSEVVRGLLPTRPYLVLGQQAVADPSRAPEGAATLWGYTHVPPRPRGDAADELDPRSWEACREGFADRLEARIEEAAPGFRALVLARRVWDPRRLEAENPNLVGGEHNGGTAQLHQQLVFRPLPGWFRYRTPVRGLYLCSASAHPGGGVHGACGGGAAAAALRDRRLRRI